MSSGHEGRRDQKTEVVRHYSAQESAKDLPAEVLSEIVAETAAQLASAEPPDLALQAAMLVIAREYCGQAMTTDPVGLALLGAVLKTQFPFLAKRQGLLDRVAKTVAESLLADFTARRRLEHLWAKLSEEVA